MNGDDGEAALMERAARWSEDTPAREIVDALPPGRYERWIDGGFAILVMLLLLGWLTLPPA